MLSPLSYVAFDPEAEGDGTTGEAGNEGTPRTYTQEEFDGHMAGLRKKYEGHVNELNAVQRKLAGQLEQAKKAKGLTDDERNGLQQEIDNLRSKYESDAEKAERQRKQQEAQFSTQVESLSGERDFWRKNYEQTTVTNQIYSASNDKEHRAVDPDHIAAVLAPHVEFRQEAGEDGEPNGRFVPIVRLIPGDVDSDGKPVHVEYSSIKEAVARMKQLPKYANFFEDTLQAGVGGGPNVGRSSNPSWDQLKKDPAKLRELRKKDPAKYYAMMAGGN